MSTLNLALRLDRTDLFGAVEWTLANARRTGLHLIDLCFVTDLLDVAHLDSVASGGECSRVG